MKSMMKECKSGNLCGYNKSMEVLILGYCWWTVVTLIEIRRM